MKISQSAFVCLLYWKPNETMRLPEILLVRVDDRRGIKLKSGKIFQEAVRWKVPGGRVEVGEAVPAAALRELVEEAGIKLNLAELDSTRCSTTQFRSQLAGVDLHRDHYYLIIFSHRPALQKPRDPDQAITEVRWFALNRLPTPNSPVAGAFLSPGNRKKLAVLFKRMRAPLAEVKLSSDRLAQLVQFSLRRPTVGRVAKKSEPRQKRPARK